jgi:predicted KAP-like P-loop ATPase
MSKRKLKTTSAGVDSPVLIPKDDSLSRAIFAKRIFQIISGTSLSTHLRVGIFGSWGTGKSTVLNFLKFFCHEENHPVVSFNPWRFHSRKQAWEGLVANIDKGLAEWNKQYTSAIRRQQNVRKISQKTRQFAESFKNPIVDSISKLVLSPLEGLLEQTKEKISLELEKNLADKRLYVFVDDLDRAEPAILYDTLMLLNEIFDLNRCIFIVALDEKVASEILREKLGYSEGNDFLEKIINWRFELPEPSPFDWQALLKTEVKGLKSNLNLEALESIFDYLPRNPRKFKHFLRYLGGLWKNPGSDPEKGKPPEIPIFKPARI